jgi:hypothetical protein
MDAETKKSAVGGGIIATGLVAAATVFSVMNNDPQPQVETIDQQAIVERVTTEARRSLAEDKTTMVVTPDKVHADVMLWLNDYEKKADVKASERQLAQDEMNARFVGAVEALTKKVAEAEETGNPDERLVGMLETMTAKVTSLESKNNQLGVALDLLADRVNNDTSARDKELTKVFESFDGRISRVETIPSRPTVIDTRTRPGVVDMRHMRLVADSAPADPNAELNARLARMEAMLAANGNPAPDGDGLDAGWGERKPIVREAQPAPAPAAVDNGAVPKDDGRGLIRTTARATGDTIEGGTDITTNTINNATNVTGQAVKDLTRTAGRFLGGASSTAGETIGGTGSLAKKQGKSIWSKFW